jgi:hypothetical protein
MDPKDPKVDARFSLRRWSARKLEAARGAEAPTPAAAAPGVEARAGDAAMATGAPAPRAAPVVTPELPPVETLTFESDFTAFLQPKVAESIKQQALKKLFADPRFNVMDGLDVYIDDYSIPSPLEPELIEQLVHARFTLNPPRTRVNAQGHVEDVPPEELPPADAPEAEATGAAAVAQEGTSDPATCAPSDGNDDHPELPAPAPAPVVREMER